MIWLKRIGLFLIGTAIIGAGFFWYLLQYADVDFYPPLFTEHCGDCHGEETWGIDGIDHSFFPLVGGHEEPG
ncbi:MAG: hypothetical protein HOE54_06075, partial [Gammaproteobacteria bacterium]|nr:hypothetical protein [Gammaproteobacteria bacterium]